MLPTNGSRLRLPLLWFGAAALLLSAACSDEALPTSIPALTLVPAATRTLPPAAAASPTAPPLPGPDDVVPASPAAAVTPAPDDDPVAAQLAALVRRRLAEELDLLETRIRVLEITAFTWSDSSLGCPVPGQEYAPVVVEGYRIEAAAGDRTYVFHTDSERITPCAAGRERLPK